MKTSIILRLASSLCALLLLTLAPGLASAAHLAFVEQGDVVVVEHDANFECGITYTVEGETAHVDACWITNSPPGYAGAATAYMVEPAVDPALAGAISDEIHIQFSVDSDGYAHMSVDFISDDDAADPVFPPPGIPTLTEDGTLQGLNSYFYDAAGNQLFPPANIAMYAQSDVEPTQVVPGSWGSVKAIYR